MVVILGNICTVIANNAQINMVSVWHSVWQFYGLALDWLLTVRTEGPKTVGMYKQGMAPGNG